MIADTSKINSRNMDFEMADAETISHGKRSPNVHAGKMVSLAGSEHVFEAIRDEIEDFRDELMSENFRFKAEMLKEFMHMKVRIKKLIIDYYDENLIMFLICINSRIWRSTLSYTRLMKRLSMK